MFPKKPGTAAGLEVFNLFNYPRFSPALREGCMPILSDGERRADVDNPRGYLEWERIKQLPKDPACIAEAEGKAVKVIPNFYFCSPRSTSTASFLCNGRCLR